MESNYTSIYGSKMNLNNTGLHEECGVFGVYRQDATNIAEAIYYGLYALQHRGQESAGMAVSDGRQMRYCKDMGLVSDVFEPKVLEQLKGFAAIGHVRYSTTGSSYAANAQPLVIRYKKGDMALAHNGNLVNAIDIRRSLESQGHIFQTTSDTEIIASLIARSALDDIENVITSTLEQIRGSYALLILTNNALIGIRDPYGIRPLCLGKWENGYVLASESCAMDVIGAQLIRDIEPGEGVIIDRHGLRSFRISPAQRKALCIFEFVYFARPDSFMDGVSVYKARINAGRMLAIEHPIEADIVIGVPDSGTTAALGYAQQSGIPFDIGLIKNRYVGRTFIQPEQKQREESVKVKLNALKETIEGKRVVMVDDSIVRGTTSRQIVDMIREAGAIEVHMRISSPPVKYPCYFGIDTPSQRQLVGAIHTVDEIRKIIGVDSLGYLSIDGLIRSVDNAVSHGETCSYCLACFNGHYPMDVPNEGKKYLFEKR